MPKIDLGNVSVETGTTYPEAFRSEVAGRSRQRLGNAAGLDQFGVNLTRLKPGAWSAQRHWHENEDEFVFVIEGEVVLHEDTGEVTLKAGECAGFKAGVSNGHCLINRSDKDAVYIEIGSRKIPERAYYPDIDLVCRNDGAGQKFFRRSGEGY